VLRTFAAGKKSQQLLYYNRRTAAEIVAIRGRHSNDRFDNSQVADFSEIRLFTSDVRFT
jgi:hypothetical protein